MDNIGVTWYDGVDSGGRPIIDYRLWYAIGLDGEYTVLAESLNVRYYNLVTVKGTWYKFKVQSRNSEGYGDFATEL